MEAALRTRNPAYQQQELNPYALAALKRLEALEPQRKWTDEESMADPFEPDPRYVALKERMKGLIDRVPSRHATIGGQPVGLSEGDVLSGVTEALMPESTGELAMGMPPIKGSGKAIKAFQKGAEKAGKEAAKIGMKVAKKVERTIDRMTQRIWSIEEKLGHRLTDAQKQWVAGQLEAGVKENDIIELAFKKTKKKPKVSVWKERDLARRIAEQSQENQITNRLAQQRRKYGREIDEKLAMEQSRADAKGFKLDETSNVEKLDKRKLAERLNDLGYLNLRTSTPDWMVQRNYPVNKQKWKFGEATTRRNLKKFANQAHEGEQGAWKTVRNEEGNRLVANNKGMFIEPGHPNYQKIKAINEFIQEKSRPYQQMGLKKKEVFNKLAADPEIQEAMQEMNNLLGQPMSRFKTGGKSMMDMEGHWDDEVGDWMVSVKRQKKVPHKNWKRVSDKYVATDENGTILRRPGEEWMKEDGARPYFRSGKDGEYHYVVDEEETIPLKQYEEEKGRLKYVDAQGHRYSLTEPDFYEGRQMDYAYDKPGTSTDVMGDVKKPSDKTFQYRDEPNRSEVDELMDDIGDGKEYNPYDDVEPDEIDLRKVSKDKRFKIKDERFAKKYVSKLRAKGIGFDEIKEKALKEFKDYSSRKDDVVKFIDRIEMQEFRSKLIDEGFSEDEIADLLKQHEVGTYEKANYGPAKEIYSGEMNQVVYDVEGKHNAFDDPFVPMTDEAANYAITLKEAGYADDEIVNRVLDRYRPMGSKSDLAASNESWKKQIVENVLNKYSDTVPEGVKPLQRVGKPSEKMARVFADRAEFSKPSFTPYEKFLKNDEKYRKIVSAAGYNPNTLDYGRIKMLKESDYPPDRELFQNIMDAWNRVKRDRTMARRTNVRVREGWDEDFFDAAVEGVPEPRKTGPFSRKVEQAEKRIDGPVEGDKAWSLRKRLWDRNKTGQNDRTPKYEENKFIKGDISKDIDIGAMAREAQWTDKLRAEGIPSTPEVKEFIKQARSKGWKDRDILESLKKDDFTAPEKFSESEATYSKAEQFRRRLEWENKNRNRGRSNSKAVELRSRLKELRDIRSRKIEEEKYLKNIDKKYRERKK